MPHTLIDTTPGNLAQHRAPGRWPLRLLATLLLWRQRARNRQQLSQLDPRLLSDSGISPAERDAELAKPFWR